MSGLFPDNEIRVWKVSAAWARRRHECNLEGITKRCGGMCCSSPSFWPPRAFQEPEVVNYGRVVGNGVGLKRLGQSCGFLSDRGCTLDSSRRPVTCLLYPFTLNSRDTLVGHNRITTRRGICKGNHNNGPMIIDVIRDNLIALFGAEQVDRVRADIVEGRDSYFEVPESVHRQLMQEKEWDEENVRPVPRDEY